MSLDDELREFYERYIAAFNAGDKAGFAACFHLPATMLHSTRYDERRAGRALATVTEAEQLTAPLPAHWAKSTVDSVVTLGEAGAVALRPELSCGTAEPRAGILATVTRWNHDGQPYQQIQALYLLTREDGRLGIKTLAEIWVADLPRDGS